MMRPYNLYSYPTQVSAYSSLYQPPYTVASDSLIGRVNEVSRGSQNPHWTLGNPVVGSQPAGFSYSTSSWSLNSASVGEKYSDPRKVFYSVIPYNTQTTRFCFLEDPFDISRLRQTDVFNLGSIPKQRSGVSLEKMISPLAQKIGIMHDSATKKVLGTCSLIAHDLVLTARHAIQDLKIRNITVTFGYVKLRGSLCTAAQTTFENVMEENYPCDYAIVQLREPLGKKLGHLRLSSQDLFSELALLHYPLGKPLKVSVHGSVLTPEYESSRLLVFHDTDSTSSGGCYIDSLGRMGAMHLGAEFDSNGLNLLRYAIPFGEILQSHPDSVLSMLINGSLSQAEVYCGRGLSKTYLEPVFNSYISIDEEATESEKILRKLLESHLIGNRRIHRLKKPEERPIAFSQKNLKHIASTYSSEFQACIQECLYKIGLHGFTREFSIPGHIESDHLLPCEVWFGTENEIMRKVVSVSVGGSRCGENSFPAITIPHALHRILGTTIDSKFREKLREHCDRGEVDEALFLCLEDYKKKRITLTETQIRAILLEYVNLGVLEVGKIDEIVKKLSA